MSFADHQDWLANVIWQCRCGYETTDAHAAFLHRAGDDHDIRPYTVLDIERGERQLRETTTP